MEHFGNPILIFLSFDFCAERSSQPPTEETDSSTAAAIPNGDVSPESETPADINKSDIILITGKPHNCEEAKKALLVNLFF